MTAKRNRAWVEREYGAEKWPAIEQAIDRACRIEPSHAGLGPVVAQVSRSELYATESWREGTAVVSGEMLPVARSIAYGGYQQLIIDAVLDACAPETDAVIELGSGWGRNLFRIWQSGGPPRATYIGAEFTESGRRCASRLAALEPRLNFVSTPYDYHAPRRLGDFRHATVFTAHSIEQIPTVTPALLEAIVSSGRDVTCFHFEPIGWQLREAEKDGGREGSSEAYARENDYNRNLVSVLHAAQDRGLLAIDHIGEELVGINPLNSTTMVRWHSSADRDREAQDTTHAARSAP